MTIELFLWILIHCIHQLYSVHVIQSLFQRDVQSSCNNNYNISECIMKQSSILYTSTYHTFFSLSLSSSPICSLLLTLSLSLSLSSFSIFLSSSSTPSLCLSLSSTPICLPLSLSLSLLCSRHLYSPPSLYFAFSFSLCLPLFPSERKALLFLCCKALLSIAC